MVQMYCQDVMIEWKQLSKDEMARDTLSKGGYAPPLSFAEFTAIFGLLAARKERAARLQMPASEVAMPCLRSALCYMQ